MNKISSGDGPKVKDLKEAIKTFHEVLAEIQEKEKALAEREHLLRVETDMLNAKIAKLKEFLP